MYQDDTDNCIRSLWFVVCISNVLGINLCRYNYGKHCSIAVHDNFVQMLLYLNNYCDISESSSKFVRFHNLDKSTPTWDDYLDKTNCRANRVTNVYGSE